MEFLPLFIKNGMDERFIIHRFRSTRWALSAGLVAMLIWFNYELLANDVIRWDYLVILVIMAVVKVAAMIYLHRTE